MDDSWTYQKKIEFDRWPLGLAISHTCCSIPTIEIVRAHLVGRWSGWPEGARPWLGVATEVIVPKDGPSCPTDYNHYMRIAGEVVAGELPRWEKCAFHCTNGGGPSTICHVKDIKVVHASPYVEMLAWPYQLGFWLVLDVNDGDSSVGIPGGCTYVSSMGIGIEGWVEDYMSSYVAEEVPPEHIPADLHPIYWEVDYNKEAKDLGRLFGDLTNQVYKIKNIERW